MRLEIFKDYQQVHIWTGIISGLLLFICFVAGALTMFKEPLNQWALQDDQYLPRIMHSQYDGLIQDVLKTHPEAAKNMTVYLPSALSKSAPLSWTVEDSETHVVTTWQASLSANGKLLVQASHLSLIGDFLDKLHRTAGIPGGGDHDAYGIWVMGLVAALYFIAIVSGLIIFLPTWFKDFLSLRKGKTNKRYWVDFHNILGISALPFHIVIAVTTIGYAYHDIFYASMQQLVYKDSPMFSRPAKQDIDTDFSRLLSVNSLEQAIKAIEPEFEPAQLRFAGLGTPSSRVIIGGKLDGKWIRGPEYAYWVTNPYTAESGYTAMLPSVSGSMGKIVNGFFTLHFGGFGGSLIHWVYFVLGMSGSLLFLTGNIIWIEARRKKNKGQETAKQKRSVRIMARLTIGVTLGTLIGVAAALLAVKLLPHNALDITFWQQAIYYAGFLLCIAFTFLQKPIKAAKQLLITLCVLLLMLIVFTLLNIEHSSHLNVDLGFCLVTGLLFIGFLKSHMHLDKRQAQLPTDNVWS